MKAKDWTLLVIGAANGRSLTPVQLQKALFLLERNLTNEQRQVADFYIFKPYDYGPFNAQIYRDAEQLRNEELVVIDMGGGVAYRDYSATQDGLARSAELRAKLDRVALDYLDRVVTWVRSLSFNSLVQAIYKEYPDMKANSVFRE
jgi:uncharacterized protein